MSIRIDDLRYTPELSPESTDHLLGDKQSKITCEIDFTVQEFFTANPNNRILFAPTAQFPGDYVQAADNQPLFQNLNVGDEMSFGGANTPGNDGAANIIEKVSDYLIRTDKVFTNDLDEGVVMTMGTPIKGIRYFFGLIENNESINFDSKVTGDVQKLVYENYSTASLVAVNMDWETPKPSRIGGATLERLSTGTGTGNQRFRITHTIFVDPVIISSQYNNAVNGIAPPWSIDASSLKHAFKINAAKDLSNPNLIHETTLTDRNGNVGDRNERFNGGNTNYSVTNTQYFRNGTGEEISAIELTENEIRVEISIENTIDAPFLNAATKFVTDFSITPALETLYQDNDKTIIENFYFDRALQTVGAATIAGDNFGGDQQVIKSIIAAVDGAAPTTKLNITIIFELSAVAFADINSRSTRKSYDLNIQIQDHLLSTALADLVTLKIATAPYYIDTSDPGLFVVEDLRFLDHTESDVLTEGVVVPDVPVMYSEDDVLNYMRFYKDVTDRPITSIDNVEVEIVLKRLDGAEFIAQNLKIDFKGTLDVNGSQYINHNEPNILQFPDGDQMKDVKLKRREDLDTGNKRYYELYYPFLFRWEDFEFLPAANNDFFDDTQLNNGLSHDWNRLDNGVDWGVYYRAKITGLSGVNQVTETVEQLFETFTYLQGPDWINETFASFDSNNDPITGSANGYEDTKITVSKTYDGAGVLPTINEVEWRIFVEIWRQGSLIGIKPLSSVRDLTQYSWLKSIDNTNLVDKTVIGSVHTATFLLDSTKIQAANLAEGTQLKFSGRIYDLINEDVPLNAKRMTDGTPKKTTTGLFKLKTP